MRFRLPSPEIISAIITSIIADRKALEKAPTNRGRRRRIGQGVASYDPPALIDKLRDIVWWDRMTVNEVVRATLEEHVHRLERKRAETYPKRGVVLRRWKPLT